AFSTAEDVAVALRSGARVSEREGAHGSFDVLLPGRYELSALFRGGRVFNPRGEFFGLKWLEEPMPDAPTYLLRDAEVKCTVAVHRSGQSPADNSRYLAFDFSFIDYRRAPYNPREFRERMREEVPALLGKILGCSFLPGFERDAYQSEHDGRKQHKSEHEMATSARSAALLYVLREQRGEPRKFVDLSFSPPRETTRLDLDCLVTAAVKPFFDIWYPAPMKTDNIHVPEGGSYAQAH
ncbi:hypothetical protein HY497_00510, partial [Candidatus Woesearchaeota archaeon]|nr:hypothetical protein [Candidatus Woesearchaeota archaeon]